MNATHTDDQPTPAVFHTKIIPSVAFIIMGACIAYTHILRPLNTCRDARAWTPTPADILHLSFVTTGDPDGTDAPTYNISIRYRYDIDGHTHTNDTLTPFDSSDKTPDYYGKSYALYKPHHDANTPITVLVNPRDPTQALIDPTPRPGKIIAIDNLLPILFFSVGLTFILADFRARRRPPSPPKEFTPRTIFIVNILFGATFLPLGIFFAHTDVIRPLFLCASARAWTPTPATILHLEINTGHSGRGSPIFRLHMRYRYDFDGHTHTNDTFTPFNAGDNFTTYHRRNYDLYKPHLDANIPITALVNPVDPTQALIDPAPRPVLLLLGTTFALLFTLIGAALLLNAPRLLHPRK